MELTLMAKPDLHPSQPDDADPVPDDLRCLFGRNMRAARVALRLRQQEFADKSGFSQQYVSQVEKGQINLTLDTMRRLAAAVERDVSSLLRAPDAGPDDANTQAEDTSH